MTQAQAAKTPLQAALDTEWSEAKNRLGDPSARRPDPRLPQIQQMLNGIEQIFDRIDLERERQQPK